MYKTVKTLTLLATLLVAHSSWCIGQKTVQAIYQLPFKTYGQKKRDDRNSHKRNTKKNNRTHRKTKANRISK